MEDGVLFGDFFEMEETSEQRIYRPMSDRARLTRVLEVYYMRFSFGEEVSLLRKNKSKFNACVKRNILLLTTINAVGFLL
jgi:hypothetical protein